MLLLSACDGSDGGSGPAGPAGVVGADGALGAYALVSQTELAVGNADCLNGGLKIYSGTDLNSDGILHADEINDTSFVCSPSVTKNFNRVAFFPVCVLQTANNQTRP